MPWVNSAVRGSDNMWMQPAPQPVYPSVQPPPGYTWVQQPTQQPSQNTQQISYQSQQSAPPQEANLRGRPVEREEDIRPNEIPMDGNFSFFPVRDLSKIYAKAWDSTGGIYTKVFEPIIEASVVEQPDPSKDIFNRLDALDAKIEMLVAALYSDTADPGDSSKKKGDKK